MLKREFNENKKNLKLTELVQNRKINKEKNTNLNQEKRCK